MKINFKIGEVVTNADICKEFKCSNSGGMRYSKINKTLTVIFDHTKGFYEDRWENNTTLLYTGMGKVGDQKIDFKQNKRLKESNSNNIDIHVFEVHKINEYIYLGKAKLSKEPYENKQMDINENIRTVWIFPLEFNEPIPPLEIDKNYFNKLQQKKTKILQEKTEDKLRKIAEINENKNPNPRKIINTVHPRELSISLYAKKKANGYCQLCKNKAPFKDNYNNPYLETHHIIWLSKGGEDTIDNTVALCPNCHRKLHILNLPADIEKLKSKQK